MTNSAKTILPAPDQSHVASLDLLRAIAILAVCWFHFTNGREEFLPDGWLKSVGAFGWLGVQMFFVVSGFVIPWSLHRGGYHLHCYGRFILKRLARLDPPYLLSVVLVLLLGYLSTLSPLYRGNPFVLDWGQIALHLGYLNVFFQDKPWLNNVFWTLAIEFEFYLLIGLIYPLLASRSAAVRRVCLAAFTLTCLLVADINHLLHHAPIFALGIVAFQRKANLIGPRECVVATVLIALATGSLTRPIYLAASLPAMAVILYGTQTPPLFRFFGLISYSLYLLHVPLGMRVINLSLNWQRSIWESLGLIGLAFAVSTVGAYLFYRFVERASQALSSRIKYPQPPQGPDETKEPPTTRSA